jgi:hypothetical protein
MAKKSKRQRRKSRSITPGTSSKTYDDFNPDYSQTIKDLKRIGMLAGSFFIVLVVLAIFLR